MVNQHHDQSSSQYSVLNPFSHPYSNPPSPITHYLNLPSQIHPLLHNLTQPPIHLLHQRLTPHTPSAPKQILRIIIFLNSSQPLIMLPKKRFLPLRLIRVRFIKVRTRPRRESTKRFCLHVCNVFIDCVDEVLWRTVWPALHHDEMNESLVPGGIHGYGVWVVCRRVWGCYHVADEDGVDDWSLFLLVSWFVSSVWYGRGWNVRLVLKGVRLVRFLQIVARSN